MLELDGDKSIGNTLAADEVLVGIALRCDLSPISLSLIISEDSEILLCFNVFFKALQTFPNSSYGLGPQIWTTRLELGLLGAIVAANLSLHVVSIWVLEISLLRRRLAQTFWWRKHIPRVFQQYFLILVKRIHEIFVTTIEE